MILYYLLFVFTKCRAYIYSVMANEHVQEPPIAEQSVVQQQQVPEPPLLLFDKKHKI